jgi:peptidoglycan/xylan/chitin deacetylase (PgdA/CDA1 family)
MTARPYSRISARVLSYHAIGVGTTELSVTRTDFERQMNEVVERYTPVDLRTFRTAQHDPSIWPENAVLVTFDDALECVFSNAFPVLERLGIPFTVFVPTAFVAGVFPIETDRLPTLSWPQILKLVESGRVVCGSHTRNHRLLPETSEQECSDELLGSKHELEDQTGTECFAFCYPRCRVDARSMQRVRQAGYACAFGATGRTSFGTPLMRLRRLQIERGHDLAAFRSLLRHRGYPMRSRFEDIIWGYQSSAWAETHAGRPAARLSGRR